MFDLLAVQGTFRSLLQHHSLKASILWCSAFLTVQLSQSYMTSGKTIALTIQTSVGRVMSLLFYTMSRFAIAFLSRGNYLLISWLQSLFTVILEPKKRKRIFLTQGSNPSLLNCRWIFYCLSHQGSPRSLRRQMLNSYLSILYLIM